MPPRAQTDTHSVTTLRAPRVRRPPRGEQVGIRDVERVDLPTFLRGEECAITRRPRFPKRETATAPTSTKIPLEERSLFRSVVSFPSDDFSETPRADAGRTPPRDVPRRRSDIREPRRSLRDGDVFGRLPVLSFLEMRASTMARRETTRHAGDENVHRRGGAREAGRARGMKTRAFGDTARDRRAMSTARQAATLESAFGDITNQYVRSRRRRAATRSSAARGETRGGAPGGPRRPVRGDFGGGGVGGGAERPWRA